MAVLVFLPRAAGAGVVTAYFGLAAYYRNRASLLAGGLAFSGSRAAGAQCTG